MIDFYYVDKKYLDYLRTFDSKVPRQDYNINDKFFCGVVFKINNIKYYAPISHDITKRQTSFIIYEKKRPIATIKFSFMIPVPDHVLFNLNINQISKIDPQYASLLRSEFYYCSSHERFILNKASSIYKIGCNPNHRLNKYCCDFLELEKQMVNYK